MSAPASSTASIATESYIDISDSDKQTRIKRGVATAPISPVMIPFLRSAPQPFAAGRGLLLTFGLPDGPLHIIALSGSPRLPLPPKSVALLVT